MEVRRLQAVYLVGQQVFKNRRPEESRYPLLCCSRCPCPFSWTKRPLQSAEIYVVFSITYIEIAQTFVAERSDIGGDLIWSVLFWFNKGA